ncbi:hypothetical protein OIU76_007177 [Salix suchowensis]|nr:hypothetical protein OIU76_007177 [Salix suchowensis]
MTAGKALVMDGCRLVILEIKRILLWGFMGDEGRLWEEVVDKNKNPSEVDAAVWAHASVKFPPRKPIFRSNVSMNREGQNYGPQSLQGPQVDIRHRKQKVPRSSNSRAGTIKDTPVK